MLRHINLKNLLLSLILAANFPSTIRAQTLQNTHRLLFSGELAANQAIQLKRIEVWVPKSTKLAESEHDHTVLFNSDMAADIVVVETSEDGKSFKRNPSFFQLAGGNNHSKVIDAYNRVFDAMIDYPSFLTGEEGSSVFGTVHLEFVRHFGTKPTEWTSHLSVKYSESDFDPANSGNMSEEVAEEVIELTPLFAAGSSNYYLNSNTFQTDPAFLVEEPVAIPALRLEATAHDFARDGKKFEIEKYVFDRSHETDTFGSELGLTQLPWEMERYFGLNSSDARKIAEAAHYFLRKYMGDLGYRTARKQRWSNKILFSGISTEGLTVTVTKIQTAGKSLYRFDARLHPKGREAVAKTYSEIFARGMPAATFIFDQSGELVNEQGFPLLAGGLDSACRLTLVRLKRHR
jgi:hypothetical protein